jgi:Protein of unknown function (DUF2844)
VLPEEATTTSFFASQFNSNKNTLMPRKLSSLLAVTALSAVCQPAMATLGGAPLTALDNHVALVTTIAPSAAAYGQAPGTVAPASAFTINVEKLDSGTTVKEYVANQSGQVFAVAWYGPARPPLREVLGAAALSTFIGAPATSSAVVANSLSSRTYKTADLVVHMHGVTGNMVGFAYLPKNFPPGVTPGILNRVSQ